VSGSDLASVSVKMLFIFNLVDIDIFRFTFSAICKANAAVILYTVNTKNVRSRQILTGHTTLVIPY
jgi:hypothetical protein